MAKSLLLILFLYAVKAQSPADCPTLDNADDLSQTQLLKKLTDGCRYDRLERPITYTESGKRLPIDVYVRCYVYFIQNLEAHNLQFKIHALLQLRFLDQRLTFGKVAPTRQQPILGEKQLRDHLWMPHIFLANERDSNIMGTNEKDILTSISPDGTVITSSRIKATLYCWMNLQKFPFDEQYCATYLESWMYNTSELIIHWEQKRPITFDPDLHLTEYVLQKAWSNETVINADLNDLRHGAFAGNYSSLSFTVHLTREVGYYLMDYFLPSMLIVGISWVSFWLEADQAPSRIALGTSTMLTFITLASAQAQTSVDCPSFDDADSLSQTQLLERLTHGCYYDRLERPITYNESGIRLPVDVYVRLYVYFMQNSDVHDLQFEIHALLQVRFLDARLGFRKVAPTRKQPILGKKRIRDNLWMPHIFFVNERDSSIMGTNEEDILISVSPDGTVIISSRIEATLYCWMNLKKFPFDGQHCSTYLESWMYNTSELVIHWEQNRPITFDPDLHLTEYLLQKAWSNETVINADLNDLRHGAFAGNYSSLTFTVHLTREVGFYLMDYFLPSMLIVGISWVSFWLQADQSSPRIALGTTTLLTFITLASAQGKTLPKVSYIKISEVWFLGCTIFIFGSLLEFAFVNTIWRRKRNVNVKSMSSKHILKSTLSPRLSRRKTTRSRSFSTGTRRSNDNTSMTGVPTFNNYFTVHSIPITTIHEHPEAADSVSSETTTIFTKTAQNSKIDTSLLEQGVVDNEMKNCQGWTTLTPQEISQWIDAKARVLFPLAFLVFNCFFWTFVYIL